MKFSGRTRKLIYICLLCFFILLFLVSAVLIAQYMINSHEAGSTYDDLSNQKEQILATLTTPTAPSEPTPPPTDPSTGETIPTEQGMLPEYQPFYEQNSDIVGWLNVPGTKVNYPVVRSPESNPDFYLYRRFDKLWSDWGAVYCRPETDVDTPSDNVVLYGHHMLDGSMFTGLDPYRKQDFWQEHQTLTFDTLYEHHTYKIWAAFKTSANEDEGFMYHRFLNAADEEEFNQFVSTIKGLQYYDTGITPQFGDKLLLLSTCEYSLSNGRFIVCAVRVDE